jgi:hypothetical protein
MLIKKDEGEPDIRISHASQQMKPNKQPIGLLSFYIVQKYILP